MEAFEISVKRFDEFAARYADRFNNVDPYLPSIRIFCDLITRSNPRILELACGPGNITLVVKRQFPFSTYIAIDLAPKMIEIAREQVADVDFRIMDMRDIANLDSKFDAILCSFGLPFLSKQDAGKLISDCAGLLNKNGVLYISTMEGDESQAGFEPTSFSGRSEVYFNYHRQKDLEEALAGSGFHIHEMKKQDFMDSQGDPILVDLIFIATKNF